MANDQEKIYPMIFEILGPVILNSFIHMRSSLRVRISPKGQNGMLNQVQHDNLGFLSVREKFPDFNHKLLSANRSRIVDRPLINDH